LEGRSKQLEWEMRKWPLDAVVDCRWGAMVVGLCPSGSFVQEQCSGLDGMYLDGSRSGLSNDGLDGNVDHGTRPSLLMMRKISWSRYVNPLPRPSPLQTHA
jgi:hypothetical protein